MHARERDHCFSIVVCREMKLNELSERARSIDRSDHFALASRYVSDKRGREREREELKGEATRRKS